MVETRQAETRLERFEQGVMIVPGVALQPMDAVICIDNKYNLVLSGRRAVVILIP
jgi:hypothetical protein